MTYKNISFIAIAMFVAAFLFLALFIIAFSRQISFNTKTLPALKHKELSTQEKLLIKLKEMEEARGTSTLPSPKDILSKLKDIDKKKGVNTSTSTIPELLDNLSKMEKSSK